MFLEVTLDCDNYQSCRYLSSAHMFVFFLLIGLRFVDSEKLTFPLDLDIQIPRSPWTWVFLRDLAEPLPRRWDRVETDRLISTRVIPHNRGRSSWLLSIGFPRTRPSLLLNFFPIKANLTINVHNTKHIYSTLWGNNKVMLKFSKSIKKIFRMSGVKNPIYRNFDTHQRRYNISFIWRTPGFAKNDSELISKYKQYS